MSYLIQVKKFKKLHSSICSEQSINEKEDPADIY